MSKNIAREAVEQIERGGYKGVVLLAWTNSPLSPGIERGDLVYYGGVERVERQDDAARDKEALEAAMDRVMAKVDDMIRNPAHGGAFAGLPVEIAAVFETGSGDVLISYRVPFGPEVMH